MKNEYTHFLITTHRFVVLRKNMFFSKKFMKIVAANNIKHISNNFHRKPIFFTYICCIVQIFSFLIILYSILCVNILQFKSKTLLFFFNSYFKSSKERLKDARALRKVGGTFSQIAYEPVLRIDTATS